MIFNGDNSSWLTDVGVRGVIARVVRVIAVALLGALLDGTLLDGRVGEVGVELRQEVVSPGSSYRSSEAPVVSPPPQRNWE